MKRKALLAITGCTPKVFETYSARGKLPFSLGAERWSDYTIDNALELKLMIQAADLTSLDNASMLAGDAIRQLRPLDLFSFTGTPDLFAALVTYEWPDKPGDWDARTVVAGRWEDLDAKAREHVEGIAANAALIGMIVFPVKTIANEVLAEAREFGLPEGDVRPVPEDLTGFPDWFVDEEQARRRLILNWSEDD